MYNLGLKLGSINTHFTKEIRDFYSNGVFKYIELFVPSNTYETTIDYWKQFNIPFVIHAPHSAAGLNLAVKENKEQNKVKIEEAIKFADSLNAEYIIFHSGTNGTCEETILQLKPYADKRFLIENKPLKGLDGSKCVGINYEELKKITSELNCGFALDFGHAICAANSYNIEPIDFISKLMQLNPKMFHLTDGDFKSELDSHLHYGEGTFPIKKLLSFVPKNMMITNEAKRNITKNLKEFLIDSERLIKI